MVTEPEFLSRAVLDTASLFLPISGGMVRLSWPEWLLQYRQPETQTCRDTETYRKWQRHIQRHRDIQKVTETYRVKLYTLESMKVMPSRWPAITAQGLGFNSRSDLRSQIYTVQQHHNNTQESSTVGHSQKVLGSEFKPFVKAVITSLCETNHISQHTTHSLQDFKASSFSLCL